MSSPRRYAKGVTNVGNDKALYNLPTMDPKKVHMEFYDFDIYTAGDWVVTETGASATQALTAGDGGRLALATSAADDGVVFLQKAIINFALEAGKQAWFGIRFQTNEATANDFFMGISTVDTSPVASAPTNGVFFQNDDADLEVDFYVRAGGAVVASLSALGVAMADDTWMELEWYFDGVDTFYCYQNGTFAGKASSASFPTTAISMNFGMQNGAAAIKTMTIDWVYAAKERS